MWLINWLLERVNSVLEFFGVLYGLAREVVLNAWSWIQAKGREVYLSAVAWAESIRSALIAFVAGLINEVRALAITIRDWLYSLIQSGQNWLYGLIIEARDWLYGQIQNAIGWLWDQIQQTQAWAYDLFQQVQATAAQILPDWTPIREWVYATIAGALSGITPQWLYGLLGFSRSDIDTLYQFLQRPAGVTLAVVERYFLDLLDNALGYALGTTDRDLPAKRGDYQN